MVFATILFLYIEFENKRNAAMRFGFLQQIIISE